MDPLARARLLERREMLALRRRRASISEGYRRVALPLCRQGVRCPKLMPVQIEAALGGRASGPGQDEELDLGWVPGNVLYFWSSPAERDALCRAALEAVAGDDEKAAIVWHPARAGARLPVGDLKAHVSAFLDEGNGETTWIAGGWGSGWLVQVAFWSSTIAYAPDVPPYPWPDAESKSEG